MHVATPSTRAGLDNLHEPDGPIAAAQEAASNAFGAAQTHFLVNGTTGGVLATVSACCGPDAILVTSRASHISVFNAAATAGRCTAPKRHSPVTPSFLQLCRVHQ
jgi:arginine/lysine/ornithine decarboxylase